MVIESRIAALKALCGALPDRRKGDNTSYTMGDIAMGAFGVFFMQSPSFLAHQTALERARHVERPDAAGDRQGPDREPHPHDARSGAAGEARKAVGTRRRFFEDLRALTTYLVFPTWALLAETLIAGKPPPAVFDG